MQRVFKRILSLCLAFAMCLGITAIVNGSSAEYVVADAATDYYASITAKSGNSLLGQVHDLITTTHKTYTSYADCKNPTYVKKTDPGSSSSYVMEFYSQADISANWGSGAVGTWNREHVWCQSLSNGLWGESGGGADMHHIRPVETRLNSTRGNNKFGLVSSRDSNKAYYKDGNGKDVAHAGYNKGGVFEPLDNVKGDVARIVMYMYTHYNTYKNVYGTTNGSGSYFGTLNFTNIMSVSSESAAIELLLQWNESDPVDESEITRNDAVYSIQGNRNPFIDHPEYANAIWGDGELGGGGTTDPSVELKSISISPATLNLYVGRSQTLTVTPNPSNAKTNVSWTSSNESVATVSSSGEVTAKAEGTATITATDKTNSSIKATAKVTVEKSNLSSITITRDSFSASGSYGFHTWSEDGISGTAYIYGGEGGMMQFNSSKSSYYLASTTATPAPIKSVTVKLNSKTSGNKDWKLLTSTSAYGQVDQKPTNGTDRGTKSVTTSGVSWTVSGNDTYFALTYESTNACYVDSIVVEFAASSGGNTHTHSYTALGHNGEQHWRYCPDDNEIDAGSYENHKFSNGVCTVCKYEHINHDYKDGVCAVCGKSHEHHEYENGVCAVCGVSHENHEYENGVCAVCGSTHENHDYKDGVCAVCGVSHENHDYKDGVCTVCGVSHENHDYKDGICTVCGYVHTGHNFVATHNDSLHWQECSVCHFKQNQSSHNTNGQGKNSAGHWNYCTDCGYVAESTRAEHSFEFDGAAGKEICSQCGYTKGHEHTLEWESDKTAHWQQCTECDHIQDKMYHAWSAWTPDGNGETHSRNTVCDVEHKQYTESVAHEYKNGVCTECHYEHTNHEYENGECKVCGVAHTNHEYENGECKVCGVAHTNHEYENGKCTVCGLAHDNHSFSEGICTVCGAKDPDYTGGGEEEDTRLQEFQNAVANIVTNGTLNERLTSINKAIVAYQALSDEQKALAEEDIATLKEAINDYNQTIASLNEEAEKANNAATGRLGA